MKSSNDLPDLRVRRTYKFLWEALMMLMTEHNFESITVTDICTRAMVHRTTFYKHYEDKNGLLMQGIQNELNALFAVVDAALNAPGGRAEEADTRAWLIAVFAHVQKQKEFYRLMLTGDGASRFSTLLRKALAEHIERHLPHKDKHPSLPLALHTQLHAASMVSTLTWWLEHDCPYAPAEMIKHIKEHMDLI
ncbi:TetR/AcrR family transcriptional regulator [soil metagenome]